MPNPNKINQVETPVDIAVALADKQMEAVLAQIVGQGQQTRTRRVGGTEANVLIDTLAEMVPEG
jgi:hypothetical protein